MQSDVMLQRALVRQVQKALEGYVTINNGEEIEFHVYPQSLPAKRGKESKDQFPYVLVCLDEETIAGEEADNICSVYFLVGIQDTNPNRQGHFDVANIMDKLTDCFLKNRLIDQRYRIQFPIVKKFQEEDTWPKYIGGLSTLWAVHKADIQETEYD